MPTAGHIAYLTTEVWWSIVLLQHDFAFFFFPMPSVFGQTIVTSLGKFLPFIVLSKIKGPVTQSWIMQLSPKICMKTSWVDRHNAAGPISIGCLYFHKSC